MFLLTEMKYHLLRGRGRSVLMVCIAALLLGVMGFYLGNIQINQAALGNLAEQIPVPITVTSRDGSKRSELNIYAVNFDKLVSSHVEHVVCTAEAAGAFSEEARSADPFTGGDTSIQAANCFEGFGLSEELFSFAEGYGPSLFEGTENLCVVNESFAQEHGIEEGEEFSLEIYLTKFSFGGLVFHPVGEVTLKAAGFYTVSGSVSTPTSLFVPVGWFREVSEQAGVDFYYDSCKAVLSDPLQLNDFKKLLPKYGFMETFAGADGKYEGDAVVVEDELFIKTSVKLRENIRVFRAFLIPFFGLVILLAFLSTFLLLRGSRRDMALARSLGRPKAVSGFTHFLAVMAADLIGALLALPVMLWGVGISLPQAAVIVGLFLLCAAVGAALALVLLLRFRALALLTKVD